MANLLLLNGQYATALDYYERADRIRSELTGANRLNHARALLGVGRLEDALAMLRDFYVDTPTDPQVMQTLAAAEERAGNHDAARALYFRLYLLSPAKYKDQFYRKWLEFKPEHFIETETKEWGP